jgi:TonB-linked SusC/RagA family outer membrane protein
MKMICSLRTKQLIFVIMRMTLPQITAILLFWGIAQAHPTEAQEILDKTITLKVEQKSLKDVLVRIEKETQIKFVYSNKIVQISQKVSIEATSEKLSVVLQTLLSPLKIGFEVVGKQIVLKKETERKPNFSFSRDNPLEISQIKVAGTITDENGVALVGASVLLKGTTTGTISDVEGKYAINIPDDKAQSGILVFSYIGYVLVEKAINNQAVIDVALQSDVKALQDIVVVGYGTQKKVNLTGAVVSIDQKFLSNRPITNSSQALQGLSGVYVNMSGGRPGADDATIRIRGVGSFGTNNNPLVLVDGVEYNLRDVNPADIESITVLKDAASSAIYGNRGANGVVLIKTRGGEKGKFRVDYNAYVGTQQATTFPDVVTNAVDYMEGKNLALKNQGSPAEYTQALIDEYKAGNDAYIYPNSNWFEIMFRSAIQQEHNLRFSGGNDRTTFALSLGYLNQDGILLGSDAKRYSINLNIASEITSSIRVGGSILANLWDYRESAYTANDGNGEGGLMGLIYRGLPMQTSLLADGSYADQWVRVPGHNFFRNPYALANEGFRENDNFNTIFNLFAEVKLASNLKYKITVAPNIIYGTQKYNYPNISLQNPKTGVIMPMGNIPLRGVRQELSNSINITNFHTLTWNKTVGNHAFDMLSGMSIEMFGNQSFFATNQGYFANEISELDAGSANPQVGGVSSQSRLMSFFGRVNYVLKDKYLFEANFRYDGSSRFAKDKRWGFFPSLSAGWRLNEEDFFKNIKFLSNLKLRASWGQLGSQPQQLFGYIESITSGINYSFNNALATGGAITQVAEQNLTWEKTTMTNFGVEFGFFDQRLTGEVDWFDKTTSGILRQVNVPQQVGNLIGPVRNLGKVQNQGIELTLNWRDKIGSFNYNLGGNLLYITNRVLSTNGQQIFNGSRVIFEDYPIDSYYGLRAVGYFQNADEVKSAPFQNTATTAGDIRYQDLNGDGRVDNQDRTVIGNTIPKYTYSFNLGTDYKGFDFSMLFQGVAGLQNYVNTNLGFPYRNGAGVTKDWLTESWTADNPNAKYPRITTSSGYPQNFQVSDFWLRNASYLRLKNIQVGYSLPEKLIKKLNISKFRVFINGQNILTFTDFALGDPERNVANENIIAYPIAKTITGGLSITF